MFYSQWLVLPRIKFKCHIEFLGSLSSFENFKMCLKFLDLSIFEFSFCNSKSRDIFGLNKGYWTFDEKLFKVKYNIVPVGLNV